ncbi:hypothetical protein C7271_04975 [filamentous cyanobacterium CCP5]|nr:hypothetical protein C7271_04975 [filamentous cyanobacterium CCP5]
MVRGEQPCVESRLEAGRFEQPRAATGRFVSCYAERRGDAIALRLPQSLDRRLRSAVGWQSKADNKALTAWVEAAISEKLQRQELAKASIQAHPDG